MMWLASLLRGHRTERVRLIIEPPSDEFGSDEDLLMDDPLWSHEWAEEFDLLVPEERRRARQIERRARKPGQSFQVCRNAIVGEGVDQVVVAELDFFPHRRDGLGPGCTAMGWRGL